MHVISPSLTQGLLLLAAAGKPPKGGALTVPEPVWTISLHDQSCSRKLHSLCVQSLDACSLCGVYRLTLKAERINKLLTFLV